MPASSQDYRFMELALRLAHRGLGETAPNPSVGCVIVHNGRILAQGHTQKGGRPHAETSALAGITDTSLLAESSLYVSLEPCCHQGKTPPCTDAVIASGIKRVVIATKDPDPRMSGKGIERLQQAGIDVISPVLEEKARKLNAGFFSVVEKSRPLVTLKLATTLDGKIATSTGESQWITGEKSRRYSHLLRAQHDAIMVGINTVLADNPMLNCRLPGLENHSPIRVVIDSQARLPLESALVQSAEILPVIVITTEKACQEKKAALAERKVTVCALNTDTEGQIPIKDALQTLAKHGVTRLLAEGGGKIASSLLRAQLVDQLVWIQAPLLLGNDAIAAVPPMAIEELKKSYALTAEESFLLEKDRVSLFTLSYPT